MSLLDDSDTELTSGELTLTRPMEMAVAGSVPAAAAVGEWCSSPVTDVSAVSVPELDPDLHPASAAEDKTTMGSCWWLSVTPAGPAPWSSSRPSALLSSCRAPPPEELRLMSEDEATLQTELLLPFLLEELAPLLSGQLFFTRLLQEGC